MSQNITKKKTIRITVESNPETVASNDRNDRDDRTESATVTAEGAARRRRRFG